MKKISEAKRINKIIDSTFKKLNILDEDTNVAQTILQQLGGNKFVAMTGASNFVSRGNALSMTLPQKSKNRITFLIITLKPDDTYDMDFGKFGGTDIKTVTLKTGIHANQLQTVFTDVTGLYTHL